VKKTVSQQTNLVPTFSDIRFFWKKDINYRALFFLMNDKYTQKKEERERERERERLFLLNLEKKKNIVIFTLK